MKNAIRSRGAYGPENGQLITVVCGHDARLWYHRPFFARLVSHGFRLDAFTVEPDVYTDDVEATRTLMTGAAMQLTEMNKSRSLIGLSLGADLAFMVAANDKSVRGVAAVSTGYSFARSAWNHRSLRRALQSKGWTLESLEAEWAVLAPGKNLTNARRQRFFYGYSTRDRLVGADNAAALAAALAEHSTDLTVQVVGVPGHLLGSIAVMTSTTAIAASLRSVD